MQDRFVVFDKRIDDGSQLCIGLLLGFKESGNFHLHFSISYSLFRAIIVRWYFPMVEECKDRMPMFYQ
jgi:hypothetical protein